jgi:hypothetical protein
MTRGRPKLALDAIPRRTVAFAAGYELICHIINVDRK